LGKSVAIATVNRVATGIINGFAAEDAMPPAKPLTAVEAVFVTATAAFAAPKLNHALGSLSAMKHASAHVTAASDKAVDPFNTSNEFERRAARMTSDFASSRAASWFGSKLVVFRVNLGCFRGPS
jgi:hypothetical protein